VDIEKGKRTDGRSYEVLYYSCCLLPESDRSLQDLLQFTARSYECE